MSDHVLMHGWACVGFTAEYLATKRRAAWDKRLAEIDAKHRERAAERRTRQRAKYARDNLCWSCYHADEELDHIHCMVDDICGVVMPDDRVTTCVYYDEGPPRRDY